ncbi:MAG: response regulator transcription factor [Deltaproteobacteria bacterium]|nr:response regulator transcription factor [Deltaproteobacteria bacterium]
MAEKLLIIEDDPAIQRGLQMNLRLEGYEVVGAHDGEEGLRLWRQHHPDLIVLDLMLPKLDGIEVLREIRGSDPDTRILILSSKDHEADKVLGLSLGADDYLPKPFGLAELLARIRAALRRARREQASPAASGFGRVALDVAARRVTVRGAPVELTAREFDLLLHFVTHPGRVFSREQLMQAVWGPDHFGTPRTVDNFVARLRLKLEERPDEPRHFETVRGVGYRFSAG